MQTVHLTLYSETLDSAVYQATADASQACLTISDVPDGVLPATVARHANETAIRQPSDRHDTVSYDQLGRVRTVNLYRAAK